MATHHPTKGRIGAPDCEGCGAEPPERLAPDGKRYKFHDYCVECQADLCDRCMVKHPCPETVTGRHIPSEMEARAQ